ncbi:MAG: AEC family transporter [Lentisphaerota bacterium]
MYVALQIFFILLLLGAGVLARKAGMLTRIGTSELAKVLMGIIYPALILYSITRKSLADLIANWPLPLLTMLLAVVGLWIGLATIKWMKKMPDQTARGFLFHCMMNNYLFLPLPIVLLLFGADGVSLLIFSSVGFELLIWTVGVFILAPGSSLKERIRMSMGAPPIMLFIALMTVVVRDTLGIRMDQAPTLAQHVVHLVEFSLNSLGNGTVPLSFIVAGSRMADLHPHFIRDKRIWMVSTIRLIVIPAVMLLILAFLPITPLARGVLTVVAVMPSAVASIAFSERFGGDGEFIAGALLLTHIGALITVPLFLALAL